MRKLALFCATLLASSLSLSASAYSGYIGGGFHMGSYNFNTSYGNAKEIDPNTIEEVKQKFSTHGSGLTVKIGQYLAPAFAIEAQFVGGLSGDTITYKDAYNTDTDSRNHEADVEFKSAWGLFAKPMGFVTDSTKVYGLIGFGGVTFDIENEDDTFLNLAPDSGFAYGLGFETEVEYGVFLGAEYVSYLDQGDGSYDSLNLTLSMYVW